MRSFTKDSQEEPTINLTPLIDVVFVILILFILIAPMLELDRVELASAGEHLQEKPNSVQENGFTTIYVKEDDSIWFQQRMVTSKELLSMLKEAKSRFPQSAPQLFQDKRAHFGTYQEVKNAVEMAGFHQLDIVLQPHGQK
jgi:biopolymer transport protein ExbD